MRRVRLKMPSTEMRCFVLRGRRKFRLSILYCNLCLLFLLSSIELYVIVILILSMLLLAHQNERGEGKWGLKELAMDDVTHNKHNSTRLLGAVIL